MMQYLEERTLSQLDGSQEKNKNIGASQLMPPSTLKMTQTFSVTTFHLQGTFQEAGPAV